jgi:hypothetical protein
VCRHGVLGDAAVMFLHRIHSFLRIRAQHRLNPVRVSAAKSPGHPRAKAERLATALHLPAVDPDRHAHEPESGGEQTARRIISASAAQRDLGWRPGRVYFLTLLEPSRDDRTLVWVPRTSAAWADALRNAAGLGQSGGGMIVGLWA